MNVSINLLPDDLRRRSIRIRVIRIWVPILVISAIAIAALSHLRWTQCRDIEMQYELTLPSAETSRQTLDEVSTTEKRIARLQQELDAHEKLYEAQNPLKFLQIVSQAASTCSDQLLISGIDILNGTGKTSSQGAPVTNASPKENETTEQSTRRTNIQLRGSAVSEFSVTRLMNKLRQSGGFLSVNLQSTQPSRDLSEMKREFIVECIREELLE